MTSMQYIGLLSPALGSLVLVVLAWMHQNHHLADLRSDVNRQFDGVNRRIDSVEGSLNRKIDGVSEQVATLASDYKNFYGLEQKLEGRVDELSKRIA